jgi:ketosteroid isomerase-like protein
MLLNARLSGQTRDDGININDYICVVWTIMNGKITKGRNFFEDSKGADNIFTG